MAAAPRLRLGKTADGHFDDVPGPARRVFSLLFLRGTTPEYAVPGLDDELISEILAAYQGRDGDAPGTHRADLAEVAAFLAAHQGAGVLTDGDQEPQSHDETTSHALGLEAQRAPDGAAAGGELAGDVGVVEVLVPVGGQLVARIAAEAAPPILVRLPAVIGVTGRGCAVVRSPGRTRLPRPRKA